MIKVLKSQKPQPSRDQLQLSRDCEGVVRPIIEAVRRNGDSALRDYAQKLDGLADLPMRLTAKELAEAASAMPANVLKAAEIVIHNIRQFAEAQLPR